MDTAPVAHPIALSDIVATVPNKDKYVSEADKVPRRMSVKLTKSLHAIEFPG